MKPHRCLLENSAISIETFKLYIVLEQQMSAF